MNSYNKGHYNASGEYIPDFVPEATGAYSYGYTFFDSGNCDGMCNATMPSTAAPATAEKKTTETFNNKPIVTGAKKEVVKDLALPKSLDFLA